MYTLQKVLEIKKIEFADKPYIFEKIDGEFKGKTYNQFVDDVYKYANYLQQEGLTGAKIALYSDNSYAYMVSDIAIMAFVGISVCISKEWGFRDLNNVVKHLNLDAIIYGKEQSEKIEKLKSLFPCVKYIPIETAMGCNATSDCKKDLIDPDKCSKIIFSSGTTGIPKAVMLSQHNMFVSWENLYLRAPMNHNDVDYLFLPLHHTYAGICNFMYSLISGMQIYLCSSVSNIIAEIQEVKPTVFCAVPLIFERAYNACQQNNIDPSILFGGNIRHMFSGGARLDPDIRKFFKSHGLNIMEAYGLSETSSLVSVEYPNSTDYTSVGTVMENVTVKIDNPNEEGVGEIIVKGDNIFLGYYNNTEETSKAFDDCGFFHTGDLGSLNGNILYHHGRMKKVIILSNGENVYPDEIVSLLIKEPGVTSAKVYEKNKKIFATIFSDKDIDAANIVEAVNKQLSKNSRIQDFEVITDSISVRLK